MTLPLPLSSGAVHKKTTDCLKAIRVYFSKSQDFHTAINWLSKHARLIHLNGRPATSNALHTPASSLLRNPTRLDPRPPVPATAQPLTSQERELPGSRSQSRGTPPSPLPALQHLQQSGPRRLSRGPAHVITHVFHGQHRESDLRRNLFALQEADRSATTLPSMGRYGNSVTGAGHLQMPRVVRTPGRSMSAARMSSMLRPRYGSLSKDASNTSTSAVLDAPSGRRSLYGVSSYPGSFSSHELSQQSNGSSGPHFTVNELLPADRGFGRLSQTNTLAVPPTQHSIAADSLRGSTPETYAGGGDDTPQRRHTRSMAPLCASSTVQLNSDWDSATSSQEGLLSSSSQTLVRSTSDVPEVPPAGLFAGRPMEDQHPMEENRVFDSESSFPRPPSVVSKRQLLSEVKVPGVSNSQAALQGTLAERGPDKRRVQAAGQKRVATGQVGQKLRVKKRKANQSAPIKRGGPRTEIDDHVDEPLRPANDEPHTDAVVSTTVASSVDGGPATTCMPAYKEAQLAEHAVQTDSLAKFQADILHLSSALNLYQCLLHEATQWSHAEDHEDRLLRLGAQLIRGLRKIFQQT